MQSNEGKWYEIGKRAVEGAQEFTKIKKDNYHVMTIQEAKDVILNDPTGNIVKRMMAIAVARSVLGENCTMEEIWKWAEGGGNNEEKAVK